MCVTSNSLGEKGWIIVLETLQGMFRFGRIGGSSASINSSIQPQGRPRPTPRFRGSNIDTLQPPRSELSPTYSASIGGTGLSPPNFLLLVLAPATIIRLIQEDEENRSGRILSFTEAFQLAQTTSDAGEVLWPETAEDDSTLTREFVSDMLRKLDESKASVEKEDK